jgi:hypothetical protein
MRPQIPTSLRHLAVDNLSENAQPFRSSICWLISTFGRYDRLIPTSTASVRQPEVMMLGTAPGLVDRWRSTSPSSGRPGVVNRLVFQSLHRVGEIRTAVAIGGDAVGYQECEAVSLHGRAHQFGGVTRAEPGRHLLGAGTVSGSGRCSAKYPIRIATTEVGVVAATHAPSASAHAFVAP